MREGRNNNNNITTTATLRPFGCDLSTLSEQANGSAQWTSGGTTVLAAVHGPAAPQATSFEDPYAAQVSFVLNTGRSTGGGTELLLGSYPESCELEPLLRNILIRCIHTTQYPRCIVQIICHVLTADGSVVAACLHAAVAALLDAGIVLQYLPTAAVIRVVTKQQHHYDNEDNSNDDQDDDDDMGDSKKNSNNHCRYRLSLDPNAEQEQDTDLAPNDPASALIFIVVTAAAAAATGGPAYFAKTTNNVVVDAGGGGGGGDTTRMTTLAAHSWGGCAPLVVWSPAVQLAQRAHTALTHFFQMAMEQKQNRIVV